MAAFPVKVGAITEDDHQATTLIDAHGYVYDTGYRVRATIYNTDRANVVAQMVNRAYTQGREDAQRDIREALGIET